MTEEVERSVLKRFDIIQKVGQGSYGIVWKVFDKQMGKVVALKKIFDAFQNDTDAQRTYREIKILQELDHENIIKLYNVIRAANDKDIYLVFEHMETDLSAVIQAGILEEIHREYIVYQILKAVKYMHSAGLMHRDLKPSNILINSDCVIKIADFGLARSIPAPDDPNPTVFTEYVGNRWYRAPEILLGAPTYTKGIDMWSVGCIIAELYRGQPFLQGISTMNQLALIMEITGRPQKEDIDPNHRSAASILIDNIPQSEVKSLSTLLPTAPEAALDLIKNLLKFNPHKRLSAAEALMHPYLEIFHNPEDEPASNQVVKLPLDDSTMLDTSDYKENLYQEITEEKKEAANGKILDSKLVEEVKEVDEELVKMSDMSIMSSPPSFILEKEGKGSFEEERVSESTNGGNSQPTSLVHIINEKEA